jgi:transposase
MSSTVDISQATIVTGGIDAHAGTHHVVALDGTGRRLGDRSFPATAKGYREALDWLTGFGVVACIGIESTGSYAAGLTRFLLGEGVDVFEVNQPHPHLRARRGKDDAIDAEASAGKALSGKCRRAWQTRPPSAAGRCSARR